MREEILLQLKAIIKLRTYRLLLICILFPIMGWSQQYYNRSFTIDDGLPSNKINSIYQDSIGYLWIGTDAGIAIFDGIEFRIINKKDGLASSDVRSVAQDKAGNFWFACYDGGVTKFDGKKFSSFTRTNGLHSNFIRRVYYSETWNTLFIGADDGFYTLKDEKLNFYGKANNKLAEEHEILWFMEGKGFVYVFPFEDNLLKFYPPTGKVIQLKGEKTDANTTWSLTSALVTSKQDTVWGNKMAVSDKNGTKHPPFPKAGLVFGLTEDDNGNVWLPLWGSVVGGILRYNGQEYEDYTAKLGLENTRCNTAYFDKKSSILWIGTNTKGLRAFPQDIFTYYSIQQLVSGKHDFRNLFYYKNSLCLLFKDQIVKFSPPSTTEIIPLSILEDSPAGGMIKNIKSNVKTKVILPDTHLWRLPEFYKLAEDSKGTPWLTTTVGLYALSADLKKVTKALPLDTRYGDLAFDSHDNAFNWGYWQNRLDIIPDPGSQYPPYRFQKYSGKDVDLPKGISKMVRIGDKMLLSSVYGGLYLHDGSGFIHLNKTNPALPDNISAMCLAEDGTIAYGTNTGEMGLGSLKGKDFVLLHHFDSLNKSYGRNILWIQCDKQFNLYAGTNKGLLVIQNPDLNTAQPQHLHFFSKTEGYLDFSVSTPVLYDDGNIWLASPENLVCINTKTIFNTRGSIPKIVLTKLETSDSVYIFKEGLMSEEDIVWKFPYNTNNLTFHFNAINLLNPEKDRFSIQLEGFDEAFREVGSDRKISYTNLPSGKYKLLISVVNLNSLQTHSQTMLEFTIRTPYWQTWWFYILTSLVVIALIVAVYYEREKRIRKDTKIKIEMAELEMYALQSQMNPHFIFNVLNVLQRYILERDVRKGVQLLSDFSKMIRQTFSLSSKRVISLEEEMTYLNSYLKLEKERFINKFQYEIGADATIIPQEVMIPSMLLQPLVENAVIHGLTPLEGNDGLLKVTFALIDNHSLKCTIEDNGIGVEKSLASKRDIEQHLSKALSITRKRIELLNQSLKIPAYSVQVIDRHTLDPAEMGTIVTITLPVFKGKE